MHEQSITEKMLQMVLSSAESNGAQKVTKIKIRIGDLSGIVEDSVEFYFRLIAKDTIAANAELEFTRVEARLFCQQCNEEFIKQPYDFFCPRCKGLGKLTGSGMDCYVESIDID